MAVIESGRVLAGRYRLSAVIGRGGMAVVWRARDELLNRDVAVKEIVWPPHLTNSEQQVACHRATREAQVAARLSHRNVIRIYDIVEEDGHPWIVMELLPYQSLRELVAEAGPLPPAQAAEIGLGILAGLRAAHAEGIVHRDVKPANILVAPDGRAVLTDFGIARATGSPTLTTAGALIGSPSYIAPEHARGAHVGAQADLWGLGASLYTAVEGRPPFERDGVLPTLTAVVADEPDQAYHAGPLWPVISGLLRKDPDARLSAEETEQMLRQVAGNGNAGHFAAPPPRLSAPQPQWFPPPLATVPEPVLPSPREPSAAPPPEPSGYRRPPEPPATPVPEPAAPQPVVLEPATPRRLASEPAAPEPDAFQLAALEPAVPEQAVPEPVVPEQAVPEPAASALEAVPEPDAAQAAAVEPVVPEQAAAVSDSEPAASGQGVLKTPAAVPGADAPRQAGLERVVLDPAVLESAGSAPAAAPESDTPEPDIPAPDILEPAAPEPAAPGAAGPRPGVPESAVPAPAVPEPAAPEPAVLEAPAFGPAVPERAAPDPAATEPAAAGPAAVTDPNLSGRAAGAAARTDLNLRGSAAPGRTSRRPPRTPASSGRGRARGLLVVLAAACVIAAVAIAVPLALTGSPRQPAASPGKTTGPAGQPAASGGAAAPASGSPGAPSQPSASASGAPTAAGGAGYGALPAGYHRFTNSTGFSIGVPAGWVIQHVGHYVYINDPSNPNIYLLIDQSDQPKPDPLADWEQQAANRASGYPDYHLIRLVSVNYPQAEKAADWEFTYDRDGVPVHILNRNVLANAKHAYALYWSTPESDWTIDYHYFEAFAATFVPAPA